MSTSRVTNGSDSTDGASRLPALLKIVSVHPAVIVSYYATMIANLVIHPMTLSDALIYAAVGVVTFVIIWQAYSSAFRQYPQMAEEMAQAQESASGESRGSRVTFKQAMYMITAPRVLAWAYPVMIVVNILNIFFYKLLP